MRLRVFTLNVWGLPGAIARDTQWRMAAIGSALPGLEADIVAFQEVWTVESRQTLIAAGSRAGLAWVWHREAAFGGSGLLVMSRLPIESARFQAYSINGRPERIQHADYWGNKGFVALTLRSELGPLAFFTTHLHARYSAGEDADDYLADRVAQVVELSRAVDDVTSPVIAAGDFNFEERHVEYALLEGLSGLRDAAAELDTRQHTVSTESPYRSAEQVSERIDYVFARSGSKLAARCLYIERVLADAVPEAPGGRAYSDHAGLLAVIELGVAESACVHPRLESVERAEALLAEGHALSQRRRRRARLSGAGSAGAAIAAMGAGRSLRRTRRGLLGNLLTATGSAALFAALGWLAIAEVALPREERGFEQLRKALQSLRTRALRGC